MIYLDSSALVKLALCEPESGALTSFLATRPGQALVSSTLHRAEVLRAIWRAEPGALPRAQRIIRRISLVSLTHDLLDNAATPPPGRPAHHVAAIHLASALTIKRDLTAFVCYDKQLSAAAQAAGLPVAAPRLAGRPSAAAPPRRPPRGPSRHPLRGPARLLASAATATLTGLRGGVEGHDGKARALAAHFQ